jgi:hypothetical protein
MNWSYIFYAIGIFWILYEMMKLIGINPALIIKGLVEQAKEETEWNKKVNEAEIGSEYYLKDQKFGAGCAITAIGCSMLPISISYWIWMFAGLMSSQWIIFLVFIIWAATLNLIRRLSNEHKTFLSVLFRVDAAISILLIVFILLNRFQLHWV